VREGISNIDEAADQDTRGTGREQGDKRNKHAIKSKRTARGQAEGNG
jgi:hypothetical protein